jgi:hypothetical protein
MSSQWDNGIIDYHFDFANCDGDGLVFYPHFSDQIVPGWFDKLLKRRTNTDQLDNVVIVAPSRDYIASLPYGKIPDRRDFKKMSQATRLTYWDECVLLQVSNNYSEPTRHLRGLWRRLFR